MAANMVDVIMNIAENTGVTAVVTDDTKIILKNPLIDKSGTIGCGMQVTGLILETFTFPAENIL